MKTKAIANGNVNLKVSDDPIPNSPYSERDVIIRLMEDTNGSYSLLNSLD